MRDRPHSHEERDFDAEFKRFALEHDVQITVEEVFHLNPFPEETAAIRQHNHAVIRSGRTKKTLTVCMTAWNWDDNPVLPTQILFPLGGEARLVEEVEGNFLAWAGTLELDPDSRSVERKFRQTLAMTASLKALLGAAAYGELLELQGAAAEAIAEIEDGEGEEEGFEG